MNVIRYEIEVSTNNEIHTMMFDAVLDHAGAQARAEDEYCALKQDGHRIEMFVVGVQPDERRAIQSDLLPEGAS